MPDFDAVIQNSLDDQGAHVILRVRFDREAFDAADSFTQLLQKLFLVSVRHGMNKEDDAGVIANPLAAFHELSELSFAEVSGNAADIHANDVAVFIGIHSRGIDRGKYPFELRKRAVKSDFDIVIQATGELQNTRLFILIGHIFHERRSSATGVQRDDQVLRAQAAPLIYMGLAASALDLRAERVKPDGFRNITMLHL